MLPEAWLGWLLPAGVCLIALLLLLRGLLGRRVGDEPRCRRCGYNLTGLPGERCPECGTELSVGRIVIGTRRRRYPSLGVGLALLLLSIGWTAARLQQVDLYTYAPFRVLLHSANQGSQRALRELDDRQQKGRLSAGQHGSLADAALIKQQDCSGWKHQDWITLLERMDVGGQLTDEQRKVYHEQAVMPLVFEVRRRIRVGDTLPGRAAYWHCIPEDGVFTRLEDVSLNIDGTPVYRPRSWTQHGSYLSHVVQPISWTPELGPGHYVIEYVARLDYRRYRQGVLLSRGISLTAEFEIVERDEDAPITLRNEPELGRRLQKLIDLERVISASHDDGGSGAVRRVLSFGFTVRQPLPVSVAFDVSVRIGSDEYAIGQMWCQKGSTEVVFDDPEVLDFTPTTEGMVVLRANPEIARGTIHLWEIWNGELVLGPIRLGRQEDRPARPRRDVGNPPDLDE